MRLSAAFCQSMESSLLIFDTDGGYRSFLGADPGSGYLLKEKCDQHFVFGQSFVTTPVLDNLRQTLSACINRQEAVPMPEIHDILEFNYLNYQPQMVEDISNKIAFLVNEGGYQPGDIAILAPFMSDALRFSISTSLEKLHIASRSHRPSRSLQDEPATACLLAIARLAHPQWALYPRQHEIRAMLIQAIDGMDLVRADLLARIVYSDTHPENGLGDFADIQPFMQERITYQIGERYTALRNWIAAYQQNPDPELDVCLSRLFGDLLSQPGFGFYWQFRKSRHHSPPHRIDPEIPPGDQSRHQSVALPHWQGIYSDGTERYHGCPIPRRLAGLRSRLRPPRPRLHFSDEQPPRKDSVLAGDWQYGLVGTALPAADPPVCPQSSMGR